MDNKYKIYEPTYSHEQKDISEHRFYIDDVIQILMQMRQAGYRYASFGVVEDYQEEEMPAYAFMYLNADDEGGYIGVDFEQIPEVPIEEIREYAFCGMINPPYRMAIGYKEVEAPEE